MLTTGARLGITYGWGRGDGGWGDAMNTNLLNIEEAGYFSVRAAGAVGDGVTDDRAAIQSAIDACEAAGGGTVLFPPGTYTGTYATAPSGAGNKVFIKTDSAKVRLLGSGSSSILTMPTPGAGAVSAIVLLHGATDSSVENLQIQGQHTNEASGVTIGVRYAGACARNRCIGVLFSGTTGSNGLSIAFDILDDVTPQDLGYHVVERCHVARVIGTSSGFGHGYNLNTTSNNRIVNNTAIFSGSQGRHQVYLSGACTYNTVANNRFESGTAQAIVVQQSTEAGGAAQYNLISGNLIRGSTGIVINTKAYFNTVVGNTVLESTGHGINIVASGAVAASRGDDNYVLNNFIYKPQFHGVLITGSSRCVISGNVIVDANQASSVYNGIALERDSGSQGAADNNRIVANTIAGTTHYWAIRTDSGAPVPTNTEIVGNSMADGVFGTLAFYQDAGSGTVGKANTMSGGDQTNVIVASTATMTLPDGIGELFTISGTANITSITASWRGRCVVLLFSGTASGTGLTVGSNLKIGANFVYTPDDIIQLVCDGTNWYRVAAGAAN